MSCETKFNIVCELRPKVVQKINYFINIAKENGDMEWVGLLITDTSQRNRIIVEDFIFPKQSVASASCEIDKDWVTDMVGKLAEKNPEVLPKMCGIIHSHDTMGTFYSSTDEKTHMNWLQTVASGTLFISIVVNDRMEMKCTGILKHQLMDIEIEDIPIVFGPRYSKTLFENCKRVWKNLTDEKKYSWEREDKRVKKRKGEMKKHWVFDEEKKEWKLDEDNIWDDYDSFENYEDGAVSGFSSKYPKKFNTRDDDLYMGDFY